MRIESSHPGAEARTAEIARKLSDRGWILISDTAEGRGAGQVLVGPGGVFALTSPSAEVCGARVREGVLWTRRAQDPRTEKPGLAVNRQILDGARAVGRALDGEARARSWRAPAGDPPAVHPLVVLWCEFPQRAVESSRIAFVHGRALPGWLAARPVELDEPAVREIAAAIERRPGEHARGHLRVPHPRLRVHAGARSAGRAHRA